MQVRKHVQRGVLGVERYIRRLQKSDNAVKRRWLIGAVTITMVCIIVLWVVYLDVTLPSVITEVSEEIRAPETGDDGVMATFMRGLGVVTQHIQNGIVSSIDQFWKVIGYVREVVLGGREFSIERE